jgi:hypothetical protein
MGIIQNMAGGEQHVIKIHALFGTDVGISHAVEVVNLTAKKVTDTRPLLVLLENGTKVKQSTDPLVLRIAVLRQHILGIYVVGNTDDTDPLVLTVGNVGCRYGITGRAEGFIRVDVEIAEQEIGSHKGLLTIGSTVLYHEQAGK